MATITANTGSANWNTNGAWVGSVQPTSADDVVIPASAVVTIPTSVTAVARSVTLQASSTLAFATGTSRLDIGHSTAGAGNVALSVDSSATLTLTAGDGLLNFISSSATTQTLTSGGKTIPSFTVNGTNLQLADTLNTPTTATAAINITSGGFDTNNQTINGNIINTAGSGTRTITLGSSAISLARNGSAMQWSGTNLTITANTAVITCTASATVNMNNFDMNGASLIFTASATKSLTNPGTWANVTVTGTASQTDILQITAGYLTCTGTFTVTGDSAINRVLIQSSILGTARTITANAVSLTNVDFRDITGAGAASWTGTTIGDRLGNSGITFTTPATQTRDATSGQAWSVAARWTSRVPLPQDDVVLDASSGNISATDVSVLGKSITATNYAGTITATSTNTPYEFFGDISLGGTFTQPNTFHLYAYGRSSHTITSNGKTMWGGSSNNRFYLQAVGGTYTLADALVCQASSGAALAVLGVIAGTLDTSASNYSVTAAQLNSATTTYTRAVNLRSSTLTLFGTTAQTIMNLASTSLTFTGGSATFNITGTTSVTKTWTGGGQTFGTVQHNSSGALLYVSETGATFTNYTGGAGTGLRIVAGGTLTITNQPTLTGQNYGYQRFWTAPAAGAFVSAPDSAALSITGDIDIRAKITLDDWTPTSLGVIVGKWGTNNQRSYTLQISATGLLQLATSTNGTGTSQTISSSTATGVTDGATKWVRATLDVDNGSSQNVVKFYLSDDGSSWTQLGTTQTTAGTTSIFDGTARLTVGGNDYQSGTATSPILGNVYRVQIRNNILDDGTGIQFDADFTTKTFGADSFTEGSSNAATVTIEGNTRFGDGRVMLDTQTAGSAAYLSKPSGGAITGVDYLKIQDIRMFQALNFYVGANSTLVSGTSGIYTSSTTYTHKQSTATYTGSTSTSISATFPTATTAGNLLVAYTESGNATGGGVTFTSGWTQAVVSTSGGSAYIWYKVSDGTETSVTYSQTTARVLTIAIVEYTGFSGTPTLDVTDSNNSGSLVTSLSTTATTGPTNTAQPALALAFAAGTSNLAAWVSATNSYIPDFTAGNTGGGNYIHTVVKELTATAANDTTITWTTSRANVYTGLAVFKNVATTTTSTSSSTSSTSSSTSTSSTSTSTTYSTSTSLSTSSTSTSISTSTSTSTSSTSTSLSTSTSISTSTSSTSTSSTSTSTTQSFTTSTSSTSQSTSSTSISTSTSTSTSSTSSSTSSTSSSTSTSFSTSTSTSTSSTSSSTSSTSVSTSTSQSTSTSLSTSSTSISTSTSNSTSTTLYSVCNNIVLNPSFETGIGSNATFNVDSWDVFDSGAASVLSVQSAEKWNGAQAISLAIDATNSEQALVQTQVMSVIRSTTYTLSFYVKSDTAGYLQLLLKGTGTKYLQTTSGPWDVTPAYIDVPTTTSWVRFTLTFAADSSIDTLNIAAIRRSAASSQANRTFYIDAVQVERGSGTSPFCPPDQQTTTSTSSTSSSTSTSSTSSSTSVSTSTSTSTSSTSVSTSSSTSSTSSSTSTSISTSTSTSSTSSSTSSTSSSTSTSTTLPPDSRVVPTIKAPIRELFIKQKITR